MTTSTFRIGTRRLSSPEQCYLDQVWSKWGFRGISLPTWGGRQYQRNPQNAPLTWVRVVWAIKHKNSSTGLTCRWVHKKMYKWKKISIIFHPFAQKQSWTDLHQIWHGCRGCRCNHLNQIFRWSVKGGGWILRGVENCPLPLTKPVAVNTGLAQQSQHIPEPILMSPLCWMKMVSVVRLPWITGGSQLCK